MKPSFIAFLLVVFACLPAYPHADKTPTEVKAMLDGGGEQITVDVREELEFCNTTGEPPGHIMGSINMPWDSGYLQTHCGELPMDKDIIVVCQSGYRSNMAATYMELAGYTAVFDMLGGMNYWEWDTESCDSAVEPGTWGAVKALYR
ncbi:MAG: rhodanese-like domain-containing protein [Candidatus Eisenbacteria bacterium]